MNMNCTFCSALVLLMIATPPKNAPPSSSSIQQTIEVRSVDLHVTIDACLFIVRLVRIHHRCMNASRIDVALQTDKIHVAVFQHVRICPPMRDVTCATSLYPHGRVLKHEGSLLVR